MAKREKSAIRTWGYFLAALWGCRYILFPLLASCAMSGEVYIMVSIVPTEFVIADAVTCSVVAVLICVMTFLWRYTDHNERWDMNRGTNKMKFKFVGGTVLAIAITAVLAYLASSLFVGYFKILEPEAYDYCIFGAITAIILGIFATIGFNEGITTLGKFMAQKVQEAKKALDEVQKAAEEAGMSPEELTAALKELAASKKAAAEAEEPPKEA